MTIINCVSTMRNIVFFSTMMKQIAMMYIGNTCRNGRTNRQSYFRGDIHYNGYGKKSKFQIEKIVDHSKWGGSGNYFQLWLFL